MAASGSPGREDDAVAAFGGRNEILDDHVDDVAQYRLTAGIGNRSRLLRLPVEPHDLVAFGL